MLRSVYCALSQKGWYVACGIHILNSLPFRNGALVTHRVSENKNRRECQNEEPNNDNNNNYGSGGRTSSVSLVMHL